MINGYLKDLRKKKKLSIRKLEELSGVSNSYISQIEKGERNPSPEVLKKLAEPLEVDYLKLMHEAGFISEIPSAAADFLPRDLEDVIKNFPLIDTPEFSEIERDKIWYLIKSLKFLFDEKFSKEKLSQLSPFFWDLEKFLLFNNVNFNSHHLTEHDRMRILDMLKLMFPEYAKNE